MSLAQIFAGQPPHSGDDRKVTITLVNEHLTDRCDRRSADGHAIGLHLRRRDTEQCSSGNDTQKLKDEGKNMTVKMKEKDKGRKKKNQSQK